MPLAASRSTSRTPSTSGRSTQLKIWHTMGTRRRYTGRSRSSRPQTNRRCSTGARQHDLPVVQRRHARHGKEGEHRHGLRLEVHGGKLVLELGVVDAFTNAWEFSARPAVFALGLRYVYVIAHWAYENLAVAVVPSGVGLGRWSLSPRSDLVVGDKPHAHPLGKELHPRLLASRGRPEVTQPPLATATQHPMLECLFHTLSPQSAARVACHLSGRSMATISFMEHLA